MITPWDALASKFNAEMVGGQLIAHINGKHVCLGQLVGGVFYKSLEAEALAEQVDELDHDGDGRKGGSRKTRKGQDHQLGLVEAAEVAEQLD